MFSIKITLLSLAAFLATTIYAAPQYAPVPVGGYGGAFVPILSQHYDLNPDQSYTFGYRSADGSGRDEVGVPRAAGPEGPAVTVQGSFTYNSPSGTVEQSYIADENGFQPSGNSVHPDIVKAVAEQVAEARANPGNAGGRYYNSGAYNTGVYNAGAFNAGAYNPGVYNPAAYNTAAYNPAAYNPGVYNRAPFRRY